MGGFTSADTHWNVGNMIYGDNADEENPIPDRASILQSANLYLYCMGNPVNLVDYFGLDAWDLFDNMDDLAKDWAENYYPLTHYTGLEYGSLIVSVIGPNGELQYYYTWAAIGSEHNVDPWEMYQYVGDNETVVGVIHSHPNGTNFSDRDVTGGWKLDSVSMLFVVVPENWGDSSSYNIRKSMRGNGGWIHGQIPDSKYLMRTATERLRWNTPLLTWERQQEVRKNLDNMGKWIAPQY